MVMSAEKKPSKTNNPETCTISIEFVDSIVFMFHFWMHVDKMKCKDKKLMLNFRLIF